MSDVSKTNEQVIKAFLEKHYGERQDFYEEHVAELAVALEAATRVPVQGEPNDDREALEAEHDGLEALYAAGEISFAVALDRARAVGTALATMPDAATEPGYYQEGIEEGIKIGRAESYAATERYKDAAEGNRIRLVHAQDDVIRLEAERDAALAAVERVTAERDSAMARITKAWELHEPFTWSFGYGPVQTCKWCADHGVPQDVASWPCPTVAALDGAPEPAAPVQPSSTVDEDALAEVLTDHVLMEPNGGTSSWSWCECSCGFEVRREGVTRDYVEKLARKHQARAVVEAIGGEGR